MTAQNRSQHYTISAKIHHSFSYQTYEPIERKSRECRVR